MPRCYVNKPVPHVQPPRSYRQPAFAWQQAAYLQPPEAKRRHRSASDRCLYRAQARQASLFRPLPTRQTVAVNAHAPARGLAPLRFLHRASCRAHHAGIRPFCSIQPCTIRSVFSSEKSSIAASTRVAPDLRQAPCAIVARVETPIIGKFAPNASP